MPKQHPHIKEVTISNAILLPVVVGLLDEGHTVTLRLRGVSMRPFLEDNRDCALLTKITTPKRWMPVLAEIAPGHYVFHRIVKIEGDHVTLRGDGNLNVEQCRLGDIKAQTIGFYRKGNKRLELVNGWKWKLYSLLWTHTLRLRPYLLAAYRRGFRL